MDKISVLYYLITYCIQYLYHLSSLYRHLSDTHVFDFTTSIWSMLSTEGPVPTPRDSHVAVIFGR